MSIPATAARTWLSGREAIAGVVVVVFRNAIRVVVMAGAAEEKEVRSVAAGRMLGKDRMAAFDVENSAWKNSDALAREIAMRKEREQ